LYLFCLDSVQIPELVLDDVLTEFRNLEKELFGRLDTSIRYYLQRRGISLKENVYIGFDTEYCQSGPESNTLVSSQLAVSCKTTIQIPRVEEYKLSRLDTETNKLVVLRKNSDGLKYAKIENSIKMCVDRIRFLRFGSYDLMLNVINESLRVVKGFKYFESDDCTKFSLPNSSIQPYINFGSSFSLLEVLDISSQIALPVLKDQRDLLMCLLTTISNKGFSYENGKDRLLENIYIFFEHYDEVLKLCDLSEKVLDYFTTETITRQDVRKVKNVGRITKKLPEKVTVSFVRTYYFIGHLTPADLSQLSDFDAVKDELSIVNGSFVTLGKAIKYKDINVHVRDTMLLAPGGSKGLVVIGGMYPNFPKLSISREDLEDMHGYLSRDRARFVEYALRDAVITLVHAL
jgi:hypothetical protein